MTLRLILDVVRRRGWWVLFYLFQLGNMASTLTRDVAWLHDPRIFSLVGSAFFSLAAGSFENRIVYQLPVSRRQVWLARWWLSTVLPAVAVQTAVSIGVWLRSREAFRRFAAALGATVGSLFHHPPIEPRLATGLWTRHESVADAQRSAAGRAPARATSTRRPGIEDRSSGLTLLMVRSFKRNLWWFLAPLGGAYLFWITFGPADFLTTFGVLPFRADAARQIEPVTLGVYIALLGLFERDTSGLDPRMFRALPLSAGRLAGVYGALAVASTVALWLCLLCLHLAATRTAPASLRPDLFVMTAGLTMLTTITLRSTANRHARAAASFGAVGAVAWGWYAAIEQLGPAHAAPITLAIGCATFAVALLIGREVVARRNYRPDSLTVRFS